MDISEHKLQALKAVKEEINEILKTFKMKRDHLETLSSQKEAILNVLHGIADYKESRSTPMNDPKMEENENNLWDLFKDIMRERASILTTFNRLENLQRYIMRELMLYMMSCIKDHCSSK